MKNDKHLEKLIKIRKETDKIGEDKFNAAIYRNILKAFITNAIDFDIYLIRTKNKKVRAKFKKVIDIFHDNTAFL